MWGSYLLADKLYVMRPRPLLLFMLSVILVFSGTGNGSAHAHAATADVAPTTDHGHAMPGMGDADCPGHEHADNHGPLTDQTGEEQSHDSCCKAQSCACGCVVTSLSVVPVRNYVASVSVRGFVARTQLADYVSPVLPHLIRPPILQALLAP
jgi:hypothetical protein